MHTIHFNNFFQTVPCVYISMWKAIFLYVIQACSLFLISSCGLLYKQLLPLIVYSYLFDPFHLSLYIGIRSLLSLLFPSSFPSLSLLSSSVDIFISSSLSSHVCPSNSGTISLLFIIFFQVSLYVFSYVETIQSQHVSFLV